jgi:hypothetical protein
MKGLPAVCLAGLNSPLLAAGNSNLKTAFVVNSKSSAGLKGPHVSPRFLRSGGFFLLWFALFGPEKPGPLGQIEVLRLCLKNLCRSLK